LLLLRLLPVVIGVGLLKISAANFAQSFRQANVALANGFPNSPVAKREGRACEPDQIPLRTAKYAAASPNAGQVFSLLALPTSTRLIN
jgi:hypothetical protein